MTDQPHHGGMLLGQAPVGLNCVSVSGQDVRMRDSQPKLLPVNQVRDRSFIQE